MSEERKRLLMVEGEGGEGEGGGWKGEGRGGE